MKIPKRIEHARLPLAAILLLLGLATGSSAQDRCEGKHARRGPPQEALNACVDAQEGASCSFVGRRDEPVSGTCEFMRDDFVCLPEDHGSRRARPDEPTA